jgi:hypothetical protein
MIPQEWHLESSNPDNLEYRAMHKALFAIWDHSEEVHSNGGYKAYQDVDFTQLDIGYEEYDVI